MPAKLAIRHELRPAPKVEDERKVEPVAHKESGRSTLGKMSMNQLRSHSLDGAVETRRYSDPAVKLPVAAPGSRPLSLQQDGFLRQGEVPIWRDEPNVLRGVAPQLIHLQGYEGLSRWEHPFRENQHCIH